MHIASLCRAFFATLFLLAASAQAEPLTLLTHKLTAAMSDLPRYERLPLFNPHRKSFTCVYQDQQVPPLDAQAELWFQQALALDNPDIYYVNRDYPRIYALYRQAAERHHWKAMLNLASLILSGYAVPEHDPEVAIRWVEKAMQLGVPDAYDRMGTYHQRGLIKGGDATRAYAFFQRAADMGSPSALRFLGFKMSGSYDSPDGEFWGNAGVGMQMLECALSQGYGDAADDLGYLYKGDTPESKLRALTVFHEGVKLGSAKCAKTLYSEFDGMNLTIGRNIVGYIDRARAERYSQIGDALEHYGDRLKLSNLDKVLPLPPAPLPKWDGNKQTLIDAAKAVASRPKPNPASTLSPQDRAFLPEGHGVLPLARSHYAVPGHETVPETGYWLALYGPSTMPKTQLAPARAKLPERYRAGERFERPTISWLMPELVQWHFLGEARALPPAREVFLAHMLDAGLLREVSPPASSPPCHGLQRCPHTGIWEARVSDDHPLAALFNRWEQQAFVERGQAFPDPHARFLDIAAEDVHWTFLGHPNADTRMQGVQDIAL